MQNLTGYAFKFISCQFVLNCAFAAMDKYSTAKASSGSVTEGDYVNIWTVPQLGKWTYQVLEDPWEVLRHLLERLEKVTQAVLL